MKEMELNFHPQVDKIFDNLHFEYMPSIPIPRLDPYVLRPPGSIDLDTLDDKFPEFKKMDEEVTAAFENFKNLPPQLYESINDWLAITSYYGVPGFKPYLDPLHKMFLTPTKTESKQAKQRVMDLTSKELTTATSIPRFTPDDLLKALEFGRKIELAEKFRSKRVEIEEKVEVKKVVAVEEEDGEEEGEGEEGEQEKEEEGEAVEEDLYDVYKPEKKEQINYDIGDIKIYLDPVIFDRDRYKAKPLTLDEDDLSEEENSNNH